MAARTLKKDSLKEMRFHSRYCWRQKFLILFHIVSAIYVENFKFRLDISISWENVNIYMRTILYHSNNSTPVNKAKNERFQVFQFSFLTGLQAQAISF